MVHPGIILDNLRKGTITKSLLAEQCEVAPSTIGYLCQGKLDFTIHLARVIARSGYGNAEQWLSLQKAYDEQRLDKKRDPDYKKRKRN